MANPLERVRRGERVAATDMRKLAKDAARGARPIRVVENSGLTIRDEPGGWLIGTDTRLSRLGAKAEVSEEPPTTDPSTFVQEFVIITISLDAVVGCHTFADGHEGTKRIWVAKPWFLRGAETWEGVSRLGVTYSNYATGNHFRTASKNVGGEQVSERQGIIPTYHLRDRIVGIKAPAFITAPDGTDVKWLDLNLDARMWAVRSDAT